MGIAVVGMAGGQCESGNAGACLLGKRTALGAAAVAAYFCLLADLVR
jgi:hypothetical protein